jgi:hypothetical protein
LAASSGRIAQSAGQEVAHNIAHTKSRAAHANTSQASTDVSTHLYDIASHFIVSLITL